MRLLIILIIFSRFVNCLTQINENFTDGDFTSNPTWTGTTADFKVNTNNELQTDQTVASSSYLGTPHNLPDLDDKEWSFRVKQTFAPSGSNFGRFYLTSASSDPTSNPDGYFIQLGEAGSNDAVRLFKQVSGVQTQLCVGALGDIASSFHLRVRVVRKANGDWSLHTDNSGGINYVLHQTTNDVSNLLGTHCAWQCTYTLSNAQKFYLDDIYVGDEMVDAIAPALTAIEVVDNTHLKAIFSEAVDPTIAEDVNNYDVQPFLSALQAQVNSQNGNEVDITLSNALQNGNTYTFSAFNMADLNGNDSLSQSLNFTYFVSEAPAPGDVVINEFMADPSPPLGLPEHEYVEIFNRSNKYFDIKKWRIGDNSSFGTVSSAVLEPGGYALLVSSAATIDYPQGVLVTSIPSLNNAGDDLVLTDSTGLVLDKTSYSDAWYQDAVKKNGGYSLERIQPFLPCSSSKNWIASNNNLGGTPNGQNSVFSNSPDLEAPNVFSQVVIGLDALEITFDEIVDSTSWMNAVVTSNLALTVINRYIANNSSEKALLQFGSALPVSQNIVISINGISDCSANAGNVEVRLIKGETPKHGDLVINEILFDPVTGGSDYVELLNTSSRYLEINNVRFGKISADTAQFEDPINQTILIAPNAIMVFTPDTLQVQEHFFTHAKGHFIQTDLPSYSNDSGTVLLAIEQQILDRVSYSEDWHFELLDSKDGKALEKLNPKNLSDHKDNWHTAAENVGFGTPGLPNSQSDFSESEAQLYLPKKVISPDNDGFEDFLVIHFNFAAPETILNLHIYDSYGRLIRELKNNELVGSKGSFTWDGLRDDQLKPSIGQYILVATGFTLDGKQKFVKKEAIVVAGKI